MRQIDKMKSDIKLNSEQKNNASRNLLFHDFEKCLSEDSLYLLRSVHPGKKHDRKFVKYSLKGFYEDRGEVIQERTLSGRTKQKITPEKLQNIKRLFLERINSERGDYESNQCRYELLNRYIANTFVELSNEYKANLKKTNHSATSNTSDVDNSQLNLNRKMSASINSQQIRIIPDQSFGQDNQNILICTPVNQNPNWNSGLLLNSVGNMSINSTPNIYRLNTGNFVL